MLSPDQQQELLDNAVEEFTHRLRQGQRPSIVEYKERYPSVAEEIEDLLTSVAMIEELKNQNTATADSLKKEMKQITRLERIGDYRIIRELGRGGMGVVFEAIHESLGRRVAIKVMPNRTFDDEKYLERFKREAQAAANLHHTNIVSVFGIGQAGEHHYYVMEFVDGESLSDILKRLNDLSDANTLDGFDAETKENDAPVFSEHQAISEFDRQAPSKVSLKKFDSPRERFLWSARIGAQLADGLAYAHGLDILHRDIKPANLLIDKHETVWLTDFGLVKNIAHQTITKTGDIIGTPQYMAPESFDGSYDQRSETYCLGLTLYEMATLRPAFENATTPELIRRITTTSPIPPNKIDRKIPRDLNRIIQKSISKEPSYRYQSAADLRDDLRAFLDDRPIAARRISMVENMYRWGRRNPLQASLSFFSAAMLLTIAVVATLALIKNNFLYQQSQERLTSAKTERRATAQHRELAERAIDVTVQSVDKLFRSIAFKNSNAPNDFSLDGFGDLEGVSATLKESDSEILEQMLEFYLEFVGDNRYQSNIQLKTLSALAQRRVANFHHLMGQFDEAITSYRQAIEIYNEVNLASNNDLNSVFDLVRSLNELGKAYELRGRGGDRKSAGQQYERAITLLRERLNRNYGKNGFQLKIELAKSLLLKGSPSFSFRIEFPEMFGPVWDRFSKSRAPFRKRGYFLFDQRKGVTDLREALQITNELIDEYADVQLNKLSEVCEMGLRSIGYYVGWEWNEARVNSSNSFFHLYSFFEEYAFNEELRFVKAMALTRLATMQVATNKIGLARQTLRQASNLMNDLVDSNRENPEYKFLLSQVLAISFPKGNWEIQPIERANKILTELVSTYENNLDYRRMLGEVCLRAGMYYRRTGDLEQAESYFESGNEMFRLLVPETPRNPRVQISGMACFAYHLETLVRLDRAEEAVSIMNSAIENEGVEFASNRSRRYSDHDVHPCLSFTLEAGDFRQLSSNWTEKAQRNGQSEFEQMAFGDALVGLSVLV